MPDIADSTAVVKYVAPTVNFGKPDTMTIIVLLGGRLQTETLFEFLPTARVRYNLGNATRTLVAAPLEVGAILCMSHNGNTRGTVVSDGQMLHFMSLSVQGPVKAINCRVSPANIHMCGVLSREQAVETAEMVRAHAIKLDDDITEIQTLSPDVRLATLRFIERFRGPKVRLRRMQHVLVTYSTEDWMRETAPQTSKTSPYASLHIAQPRTGHIEVTMHRRGNRPDETVSVSIAALRWLKDQPGVKRKDKRKKTTSTVSYNEPTDEFDTVHLLQRLPRRAGIDIPAGVSHHLLRMMCHNHGDFTTFEAWHAMCRRLITVQSVFVDREPITIGPNLSSMVNYHQQLGFLVNREGLIETLRDNKIPTLFNNQTANHVSVLLPYMKREGILRKRVKDRVEFKITLSGSVAISGPHEDINREVYQTLLNVIYANMDRCRRAPPDLPTRRLLRLDGPPTAKRQCTAK